MEKLIIHGGAGLLEGKLYDAEAINEALYKILEESFGVLQNDNAETTVRHAIRMLEDNPLFNAGTGSKLQADGQVRMSSALMDGINNRFSGVINVQNIRNPIEAAFLLSKKENTVLSSIQATEFCFKNGMENYNPIISKRLEEFENHYSGKFGTVGAVEIGRASCRERV